MAFYAPRRPILRVFRCSLKKTFNHKVKYTCTVKTNIVTLPVEVGTNPGRVPHGYPLLPARRGTVPDETTKHTPMCPGPFTGRGVTAYIK